MLSGAFVSKALKSSKKRKSCKCSASFFVKYLGKEF